MLPMCFALITGITSQAMVSSLLTPKGYNTIKLVYRSHNRGYGGLTFASCKVCWQLIVCHALMGS